LKTETLRKSTIDAASQFLGFCEVGSRDCALSTDLKIGFSQGRIPPERERAVAEMVRLVQKKTVVKHQNHTTEAKHFRGF
jgi:hypothetical protein